MEVGRRHLLGKQQTAGPKATEFQAFFPRSLMERKMWRVSWDFMISGFLTYDFLGRKKKLLNIAPGKDLWLATPTSLGLIMAPLLGVGGNRHRSFHYGVCDCNCYPNDENMVQNVKYSHHFPSISTLQLQGRRFFPRGNWTGCFVERLFSIPNRRKISMNIYNIYIYIYR